MVEREWWKPLKVQKGKRNAAGKEIKLKLMQMVSSEDSPRGKVAPRFRAAKVATSLRFD